MLKSSSLTYPAKMRPSACRSAGLIKSFASVVQQLAAMFYVVY